MPIKTEIKSLILKTVKNINHRFLIVKGWADWETDELTDKNKFKVIDNAPFQELFPLVKAIIHHGGIGTTAECLRAGKPMLICPILYPVGDQYFWGDIAHKKGLAEKPVPLSRLTLKEFTEKINNLIANRELYLNAELMAKQINAEDGVKRAVEIIEAVLASKRVTTPHPIIYENAS
jgi:sterol 3beta-glucosyltransferase